MGAQFSFNRDAFNNLPKDIQDIFMEGALVGAKWGIDNRDKDAAKDIETVTARGATVITLTPEQEKVWKEKTLPVIDEFFIAKWGERAEKLLAKLAKMRGE